MGEKLNIKAKIDHFEGRSKETLPGVVAEVLPIIRKALNGEMNSWYPNLEVDYSEPMPATQVCKRFFNREKIVPYLIEALLQSGIIELGGVNSELKFTENTAGIQYYRFNNKRIKEVLDLK